MYTKLYEMKWNGIVALKVLEYLMWQIIFILGVTFYLIMLWGYSDADLCEFLSYLLYLEKTKVFDKNENIAININLKVLHKVQVYVDL